MSEYLAELVSSPAWVRPDPDDAFWLNTAAFAGFRVAKSEGPEDPWWSIQALPVGLPLGELLSAGWFANEVMVGHTYDSHADAQRALETMLGVESPSEEPPDQPVGSAVCGEGYFDEPDVTCELEAGHSGAHEAMRDDWASALRWAIPVGES